MASNKLTYRKSGVNIRKADSFVKFISSLTRKSIKSGDFKNIGGFGAISPIPRNLRDPQYIIFLVIMSIVQKKEIKLCWISLIIQKNILEKQQC